MIIIKLVVYFMWACAIFLFGGGIFGSIAQIIYGDTKEKVFSIIGIILGGLAFYGVYCLLESYLWCFCASGFLTSSFAFGEEFADGIGHTESSGWSISDLFTSDPSTNTPANRNYGEYSGSSTRYGDLTQYSSGNASTHYGNTEYFNNGDVGNRYGNCVYYKSGGHAVDHGDVTYFYDKNGKETGKCIHDGNHDSYYGDCGPHTSKVN